MNYALGILILCIRIRKETFFAPTPDTKKVVF